MELAELISRRVFEHFDYRHGVTAVTTTAAEAWAAGIGVCQDYAHCMLALCRLCGLPARYVSGHVLGDGGTHAWVEVLVQHPEDSDALRPCPVRSRPTTGAPASGTSPSPSGATTATCRRPRGRSRRRTRAC